MTQIGKAQDPPPGRTFIPSVDPPPSYQSSDRLFTVKEAGEILGISPEAVRARLKRGTLHRETGEDGTVLVRLYADPSDNGHNGASDRMGDRTGGTSGWTSDGSDGWTSGGSDASHSSPARVEELREEVAFLRGELRWEREVRVEEKRRHDTIVLQLAQRIPELEAPRDGPETAPRRSRRVAAMVTMYTRALRSPHRAVRGCIGSSSGRNWVGGFLV